jgi:hypothetical protein
MVKETLFSFVVVIRISSIAHIKGVPKMKISVSINLGRET